MKEKKCVVYDGRTKITEVKKKKAQDHERNPAFIYFTTVIHPSMKIFYTLSPYTVTVYG